MYKFTQKWTFLLNNNWDKVRKRYVIHLFSFNSWGYYITAVDAIVVAATATTAIATIVVFAMSTVVVVVWIFFFFYHQV